jgi:hypothetical protein
MLKFEYVAKVKGLFGEKKKNDTFPADNAVKARELVTKALKNATDISLYQLLIPGEKPPLPNMQYSRSWFWNNRKKEWLRATAGRALPLSETSDEATDEQVWQKYLDSLPE